MKIHDNWKIQHFDVGTTRDLEIASPEYIDYFWMTTKVPGDVHSTLIDRNIIEDPFFGHNDKKCQWVEEKVWWYRTTFDFNEELEQGEKMELTFTGLDTYATVYLNGVELGSTENMFISHTFEVTRELKQGKNVLAVKFDPVDVHVGEKIKYYWSGFSKHRIWTRKAQSHFGWDWGPRLVAVGIWQDVYLEKKKHAKIEHVFARTTAIDDQQATIAIDVDVKKFNRKKDYRADVSLHFAGEEVSNEVVSLQGKRAQVILKVNNPKLWWTHDLGEPHLYDLTVSLSADGNEIDTTNEKIGIRTIEVRQVKQTGEPSFTFILNGKEVFAKGANWIPIDSFFGATPDARYRHLIQMSKDANMNMLRVWGGGIYEKDVFYDECNQLGILVWQDFMFACALYPDYNKNFMANVREEIESVVKRLRNHPSLALWCGNNENDWLYEALYSSGEITTPFYGEKIYHELMPELLEELDSTRLYWPSSPFGGNDHNSRDYGDTHNWQVWHGNNEPRQFGEPQTQDYSVEGLSFKKFKGDNTLFSSEFGMHASSNRYTLANNLPKGEFYWGSEEMAYRNKDIHHPKGILLMEGYTGAPEDIEEYMNYSMLTQAEGLKYGIEHYRRNKQRTSGALFWQLNDCWPGTSWSVIDYYLLPKASYHYARKFFQPTLVSIDHDPHGEVKVWGTNDKLVSFQDELLIQVYDFSGKLIVSQELSLDLAANASEQLATFSEEELLAGHDACEVVVVIQSERGLLEDNFYYLRDHKDMNLPKAKLSYSLDQERNELKITTDTFARMIKVEMEMEQLVISDNFFDLLPGEEKVIRISQAENKDIPYQTLRVTAINSNDNVSIGQ